MAEQLYDEDSFDEFEHLLDDEDFCRAIDELPEMLPESPINDYHTPPREFNTYNDTHEGLEQNSGQQQTSQTTSTVAKSVQQFVNVIVEQIIKKEVVSPPIIKAPIVSTTGVIEKEIIDISMSTSDNNIES